jgi:AAA domain/TrwC relaxase
MAVVVTAVSGYDLGYVWHNQGGQKSAAGYYIEAKDAEDKGRWFGPGLEKLGLEQGAEVERRDYDAVYRQVNPADGTAIGSRPRSYPTKQDHLARLLAAEPHATAERRIELEREAAKATREVPSYTDMTVSWSKSISLLEASIRANAHQARVDGDAHAAALWDVRLARMHEILQESARAGLEHVQRWAGVTRTGHHGARVEGQEPGRYEDADLVASVWLQGLSRAGSPQLHAHVQWARMAFTRSDGKARAMDTMSLRAQLPAVTGIVAARTEAALTREFGVQWVGRPDGKGNEIAGVTDAEIDVFSERTRDIEVKARELARKWAERNGREPSEYEMLHISKKATMLTRAGKDDGAIDWDAKTVGWDAQLDRELGVRLADIAPRVSGLGGEGAVRDPEPEAGPPSREKQRQAIADAVGIIASQKSTWTRADLVRTLQTVMPPEVSRMDPDLAVTLLDELATEATSGRVHEVVSMEAPEWPVLPESLRREVDGRSVYMRPGTTRYASRAAIDVEHQLLGDAQRQVAPRLALEDIARHFGTDITVLEGALLRGAGDAQDRLANGLRLDQGAALAHVLSSPRVAEILTGPAGTGKTRSAGAAVKLWRAMGGEAIGTATSQNATNELADAGFVRALNTTRLINAIDRGEIGPGTLIWLDEGSMASMSHLARIVGFAAANRCKVVVSGDQEQLAAVERGGGMMLLARRLGFVQLAEPQRFTQEWERQASLQLRDGHAAALDVYQDRGRLRGGDPEQVMRGAVRAFVAEYVAGRDVILTAQSWDRCRELSRQIRTDLKHLGVVDSGRHAELREGQEVSAGDLIVGRQNRHGDSAGEPGRGQANGDVMQIEAVSDNGLIVRRVMGTDRETGERILSAPYLYSDLEHADLAYCKSGHSEQGGTHRAGFTFVTGRESRQWLYAAMTRGTHDNTAFVVCKPRRADPDPSLVPAPELSRQDAEDRFRAGLGADDEPVEERAVTAVLSDVLDRDGTQHAAVEVRLSNLSAADHLGLLNVAWDDLTRDTRYGRYETLLRSAVPGELSSAELGHTATWLWRTVRQAEVAGLDAAEVLRNAVESRSLTDARDLAGVIDARIRQRVGPMVPREIGRWSDRTPDLADPELNRYVHELAEAMDSRVARLGEWTAGQQPAWLVSALGPLPDDLVARLDYEHRAGKIATYRELYNYDDPQQAIGEEPTWDTPEKRAHWQEAAMARTKVDAIDLSNRSDTSLWHMRRSYETVTSQAPEHPGRLLQDTRVRLSDAGRSAIRAEAEAAVARACGDVDAAGRHEAMLRTCREAERLHGEHEDVLAAQAELRSRWSRLTEGSRLIAVAADTELRKRHPGQKIKPLKSAEPVVSDQDVAELSYVDNTLERPAVIDRLAERQADHDDRLAQMEAETVPDEDSDVEDQGRAWDAWMTQDSQAILQPPVEVVPPAPELGAEVEGLER